MNRWLAFALVSVVLLTFLRIRSIERLPDQGYFDKYTSMARNILAGRDVSERLADYSPAYLLAVTGATAAGVQPSTIRRAQLAAVGATAIVAGIAIGAAIAPAAGVVTGGLVLLDRGAILNATDLEPETLILLLNASALALLVLPRRGARSGAAAGFLLGLSAVARPVALAPIAALALWEWRRAGRSTAALFLTAALVPIAVTLLFNRWYGGTALIMDPGSVFYEGMNPSATGYAGVQPRIVNDLEQVIPDADALHVAYRRVAAKAAGGVPDRKQSNRYWTAKALSFIKEHPTAALGLTLRKARFLISSYEPLDLMTVYRKKQQLGPIWLPFGFLVALAAAGAVLGPRSVTASLVIYCAAAAIAPLLFYVTIRQRAPLLPALVMLGGIGAIQIFRRRSAAAVLVIVAAGTLLTIRSHWQIEDEYNWLAAAQRARLSAIARNPAARPMAQAAVATWNPDRTAVADPELVAEAVRRQLGREKTPQRMFDLALALSRHRIELARSEKILRALDAYRPMRENRTTSSVAYHQARVLLLSGRHSEVAPLLARAANEAPGDADVLALQAVSGSSAEERQRALQELDRLHDPFTRDLALATSHADTGSPDLAMKRLATATAALPEWRRPALLQAQIATRGSAEPPER